MSFKFLIVELLLVDFFKGLAFCLTSLYYVVTIKVSN